MNFLKKILLLSLFSLNFLNFNNFLLSMEDPKDPRSEEDDEVASITNKKEIKIPQKTAAFYNLDGCIKDEKTVFLITGISSSGKSSICRRLNQLINRNPNFNAEEWSLLAADQDNIIDDIYDLENNLQPLGFTNLHITDLDEQEEELFGHYFGAKDLSLINSYLAHKIITELSQHQNINYIICDMILDEDSDKKQAFIDLLKYFAPNIKIYTIFVYRNPIATLENLSSRKDTRSPLQVIDQFRSLITPSPVNGSTSASEKQKASPQIDRLNKQDIKQIYCIQNFSPQTSPIDLQMRQDQMAGEYGLRHMQNDSYSIPLSPKEQYDFIVINEGKKGIIDSANKILGFISHILRFDQPKSDSSSSSSSSSSSKS